MTAQEMFNYWKNAPPRSPLQDMLDDIMKQIFEHKVTNGEIKDMQTVGYELRRVESDNPVGYYIWPPNKDGMSRSNYIKVCQYEVDAWQDAYADYAVHYLIPASLEKGK